MAGAGQSSQPINGTMRPEGGSRFGLTDHGSTRTTDQHGPTRTLDHGWTRKVTTDQHGQTRTVDVSARSHHVKCRQKRAAAAEPVARDRPGGRVAIPRFKEMIDRTRQPTREVDQTTRECRFPRRDVRASGIVERGDRIEPARRQQCIVAGYPAAQARKSAAEPDASRVGYRKTAYRRTKIVAHHLLPCWQRQRSSSWCPDILSRAR